MLLDMEDQLSNFFAFILGGLYAGFGGMIHFLYESSRKPDQPFKWFMFIINVVVAFYVGQVAWEFIPAETPSRGGLLMLAGFLAYPILDFIEHKGLRMLVQKIFGFKD